MSVATQAQEELNPRRWAALLSVLMRETRGRNIYTVVGTAHDA